MKRRIGLALGGGAARGLAHIGVIETLEENGISPDIVTGTSIGSVIGAAYAAGRLDDMKDFLISVDLLKMMTFFEVQLPKTGLFDGRKISKFLRENLQHEMIEDLGKTYAAVSCDYNTGERVVFDRGDLITSTRASYSIPGLFTPVDYMGRVLIDGGVVDPVPVEAARELGADTIIAVDLNHHVRWRKENSRKKNGNSRNWKFKHHPLWMNLEERFGKMSRAKVSPGMIEILLDSFYLMEMHLTDYTLDLSKPDIIIRPNLRNITFIEFNKAREGIDIGRKETERMMDEIFSRVDEGSI